MIKISTCWRYSFLALTLIHTAMAQVPTSQRLDPNMTLRKADSEGIIWYDPRKKPFDLTGFEWIEYDQIYRRLPVHSDWPVREAVDQLANHTAGGQVRFRTDSRRILIRVELRERSGMYHMPATGQSGFDLYMNREGIPRYLKTSRFPHDTIRYEVEMYSAEESEMQTFTLNFPLYNGVNSLQIGLEEGAELRSPPPFGISGKIVIYGTSITQGGCVTRPGMAYSNILSRHLDIQFVNLGFSGNGRGEPELAHLINEISGKRLIILDYEANAGATIKNTLGPFIDILREKQPEIPILVVSKIRYATAWQGSEAYRNLMDLRDFQRHLVESRKNAGDDHIYFLDGSEILGNDYDECTVDGVHPTDLGSLRIAETLQSALENILD